VIVDVSRHNGSIDWPRARAEGGVTTAVIRATLGTTGVDDAYARNWREAGWAGIRRAVYHYVITGLPATLQAGNIIRTTQGDYGDEPVTLDCEPTGAELERMRGGWQFPKREYTAMVRNMIAQLRPIVPVRIYTSAYFWSLITTGEALDVPLWVADYRERAEPATVPGWAWSRWQYGIGPVAGFAGNVDLNRDAVMAQGKLGPHHMLGGGADTERWLALAPAVAKFTDDFGIAASARTATLTIGRRVDDGLLDGQGFDVNRIRQSHIPQVAAAWYFDAVIAPKIATDPHIKAWEGPNEQHPTDDAAHLWYSEFCYWLCHYIRGANRIPVVGSFSVGEPALDAWRHYALLAQAVRAYGGLLALHEYGPLDGSHSLRYRAVSRELARIGYSGIRMVITECGGDFAGGHTPFKGDYWQGDVGRYYREWCAPYAAEIARDEYVVGATLYTFGSGGRHDWDAFDVNGTGLIDLISAGDTEPPPPAPEPEPEPGEPEMSQADIDYIRERNTTIVTLTDEIEARLAAIENPPPPPVLFRVQMTYPALNVRAGPATTFPDIGDVMAGQVLDVYEVHSPSGWLRIHATEQRWISGSTTYHTRL
jgi:lysozyme